MSCLYSQSLAGLTVFEELKINSNEKVQRYMETHFRAETNKLFPSIFGTLRFEKRDFISRVKQYWIFEWLQSLIIIFSTISF